MHTPFSVCISSECSGDAAHKLMRVCSMADQIFNIYIKSNELTNFFTKQPFNYEL